MADSPATAAYRKQQGLGTVQHSYDPTLVGWIKKAAAATGANPQALLATSLQESGARLNGPAGDGGTSFGPFQFHVGGALGNHPPAWASTYDAVLNRAQEFARLGVNHGTGAAAVQRPQDQALYAKGVDAYMAEAARILGAGAASKPRIHTGGAAPVASAPTTPASPIVQPGAGLDHTGDAILAELAAAQGVTPSGSGFNDLLAANAKNAGLPGAPQLLTPAPVAGSRASPTPAAPTVPTKTGVVKTTSSVPASTPSNHKVGTFEGTPVAVWMIPALTFARQNGWHGKVTSGVRSTALQAQLYARYKAGGNIAAKPGQSNHEIQNGGAFDATDAPQLNKILSGFKGQRPIWAPTVGLNDTPHFSLTGR